MPIIILEGIDGSGKTTLASNLARLSPWPARIVPKGPMKANVIEEYVTPLFDVTPDELLIADRWHLSELIYGPIYRGKTQVDWEILGEIESILRNLNATRIIMRPGIQTVYSRLKARGEDFLKPEDIPLVYSAYRGFSDLLEYTPISRTDTLQASSLLAPFMRRTLW